MNYRPYIKKDYKDVLGEPLVPAKPRRRRRWLFLVTTAVGVVLALNLSANITAPLSALPESPAPIAVSIPPENLGDKSPDPIPRTSVSSSIAEPVASAKPEPFVINRPVNPLPDTPAETVTPDPPRQIEDMAPDSEEVRLTTRKVLVKKGDTLSAIFDRLDLDQREMYQLLADKSVRKRLSRLQPDQLLEFQTDDENRIQSLVHRLNDVDSLKLTRAEKGFQSEWLKKALERRTTSSTGEITSSLFLAGQEAGLSDNVIMQLAEVLGWDIDFALDIRTGDRFTVIYQEVFDEQQQKVRDGPILAVFFNNQGREIRAVRYSDPSGRTDYYSADGYSMRKAFLRTPVNFSRISSRFSHGRYHPILNRIRAHKGVDYAAPIGTPVKATGAGKVVYKGRKGGYGRTVVIQHGGKYTTLYAHLSRYARGLRTGKRVRQGQVIGYVGKSGLATGPHLHYEFRVRNQHRDPLRVRLPRAQPIDKKYREDFNQETRSLLTQLELLRNTQLAQNDG